jgi:hypothetical protein
VTARRVGLHRDRWHRYAWNNSTWQPGVTTILRVQDAINGSDGLVRWAAKLAAEAAFNTAKRPENPEFPAALDAALTAVDGARDRGTRVHGGIEAAINDEAHVPTPEDGALYYAFTRFLLKEKPEIHATEQMVINMTAGYGGTFDLDATVRGKRALIDVKTGKPKDSHALQLAAYAGGEWMGHPDDPEKYPVPAFEAFYVLALSDEGYELIPLAVDESAVNHFLYLTETYHRLKTWTARDEKEIAA